MKMIKRVSCIVMTMMFLLSLTSCGNGKAVFTLDGTKIDRRDVDIFGYMYVMEHSLVDVEELEDIYEDGETYSEHYKNDLEKEIVLSVLLSKEADKNRIVLSSEDKDKADANAEKLLKKIGEDKLKELGIEKKDIVKLYEMRLCGNAYAASIGDEYADVLNGQSEGVDNASDNTHEEEQQSTDNGTSDRYVRVFQVTFPIAELDSTGMVKTDNDGNLITVSVEEKEQMRSAALDFSEKAKSGEDFTALLNDQPVNVTGVERSLKYDDLSDEYKASVDSLSEDGVSGVIAGEYGYYVVKLLEKDDEEHAASIEQYEKQIKAVEAKDELYEKILNTYVGNDKGYRNDELWNEISIINYIY